MRWFIAALVYALASSAALAQSPNVRAVVLDTLPVPSSGTGSCSQSSAYFTRVAAIPFTLDATHHNAYDALICGLVTDGIFSKFDAIYVLRTQDASVLPLNLVQNAFNLTKVGSITFTADVGVVSDGSTGYYDSGLDPSVAAGLQFVVGAAHVSACTTSTTASSAGMLGENTGGKEAYIQWNISGGNVDARINAPLMRAASGAGLWTASRTTSTRSDLYQNTTGVDFSTSSATLAQGSIFVLAIDQASSPVAFWPITMQAASIGGALSSSDVSAWRSRLSTYMAAIGGAAC